MKINNLCELVLFYNYIYDFYIDTGFGEKPDLTPHPALTSFIDSYSQLDNLISEWKRSKQVIDCDK